MTTRFVVAKYVPDPKRMEPRNIGVIVWDEGRVSAHFLGDGEPLPRYVGVTDKIIYSKWLASWRSQLAKPCLERDDGVVVNKSSIDYLDALREWSGRNFLLVDGGEVIDKIGENETADLTRYLFEQLVARDEATEAREHEYLRLKTRVARLIRTSGVGDHPGWREGPPTWYHAFGGLRYFKPDYIVGPLEKPYSVYSRVLLSDQKTFDVTAFHLGFFGESRKYPVDRIAAFVVFPQAPTKEQRDNREFLGKIATVIDASDETKAAEVLKQTASLNGSQ